MSQSGAGQRLLGAAEAELSTHHGGGANVPAVVAHCPPLAVLQHLHSALADHGSASQTHQGLLGKDGKDFRGSEGINKKYIYIFSPN